MSLQKDLDSVMEWSVENKIPFNLAECRMMNIGKRIDCTYRLGSHHLVWSEEQRDLGVLVCSNLKTSAHCDAVYKKSPPLLALLKRIFGRVTETTIPIVINTYIRPTMVYVQSI